VASFKQRFKAARQALDELAEQLDATGGTWTMR
jgi:hypothetical protein